MRHRKQGRKLGRTWEHRKALFINMAKALLINGRIKTTVAKAKELRGVADGLITLAIKNDLHARRQAFRILGDHQLVKKLFDEIGPRFADSPTGGYTRVVKLATPRPGDAAPLAYIEFTRLPGEAAPQAKPGKAKSDVKPAPAASAEATPSAAEAIAETTEASEAELTADETVAEATSAETAEAPTEEPEAESQPESEAPAETDEKKASE